MLVKEELAGSQAQIPRTSATGATVLSGAVNIARPVLTVSLEASCVGRVGAFHTGCDVDNPGCMPSAWSVPPTNNVAVWSSQKVLWAEKAPGEGLQQAGLVGCKHGSLVTVYTHQRGVPHCGVSPPRSEGCFEGVGVAWCSSIAIDTVLLVLSLRRDISLHSL